MSSPAGEREEAAASPRSEQQWQPAASGEYCYGSDTNTDGGRLSGTVCCGGVDIHIFADLVQSQRTAIAIDIS